MTESLTTILEINEDESYTSKYFIKVEYASSSFAARAGGGGLGCNYSFGWAKPSRRAQSWACIAYKNIDSHAPLFAGSRTVGTSRIVEGTVTAFIRIAVNLNEVC